jgi:hypothetical protein
MAIQHPKSCWPITKRSKHKKADGESRMISGFFYG